MDPDLPSASKRKVRFTPKVPAPRRPKPQQVKTELTDDGEAKAEARRLLRRVTENTRRQGPKPEKKPVQVAFGHGVGAPPSTSIRTFGNPKNFRSGESNSSSYQSDYEDTQYSSDFAEHVDVHVASMQKPERPYKEPWDCCHSYYPTILPLRRPYSGNPELLDEAEFGDAAPKMEYDETKINPALDLGTMDACESDRMLFLQFPPNLPLVKRSASAKGKEIAGRSERRMGASKMGCSLEELPQGFLGKMVVYKSGAIKLKLGDVLYDVSPGSDCSFAQDVVAMNMKDNHCCALGELDKQVVVSLDVDSFIQN
ncbi:DNA-directed RNA polymerase III subunit RPC4 [Dillenia turbinata]|uniref:DNA-directed RNA polymerase III subunit RPC4 n=1 Tax=Dillenia turbinata TaxID=194707 RepID=A0AAN8Z664_9MAGN